ncbi:hypothetical protein JTB14_021223 [Gonioctena quinquepunctata]|nr:hypothetical protein JTB14_021223 [Gonioctena quinquepunctata]
MIWVKGVRQKPEWFMHLPPGSILHMTPKSTIQMFVKWMEHFSQFERPGKILLLFDGGHPDNTIIEAADRNDVVLLCLPMETVFRPFDIASSEKTTRRRVDQENIENETQESSANKKYVTIYNATSISLQEFMREKTFRATKDTNFETVPDAQQAGPSHARRQCQTSDSSSDDTDYAVGNTSSSEGKETFSDKSDDVPMCGKKFWRHSANA